MDLQCRIHMPAQPGPQPWPMLLDVHGGGWSRFDRTRDGPVDQQLAAMQDIHSAIVWLKAHAAEFAQLYTQRGGQVELAILAGAPHIFINPGLMPDSEAMRRGLAMLKGFIARQLDYQAHPFAPPR